MSLSNTRSAPCCCTARGQRVPPAHAAARRQGKHRQPRWVGCNAKQGGDQDDDAPPKIPNALGQTIMRKQAQLQAVYQELGMEAMEERLQTSMQVPANPSYRLTRLIAENSPQVRAWCSHGTMRCIALADTAVASSLIVSQSCCVNPVPSTLIITTLTAT